MTWNYPLHNHFRLNKNKIAEDWFRNKGYLVEEKYPYILANFNLWHNNIILEWVWQYIENERSKAIQNKIPFPLHKDLHNGVSSQAMLFNLLGDVTIKKDIETFKEIFRDLPGVNITDNSSISFEFSDRKTFNEYQQQPTSFDFVIKNDTGMNIFLEAKFVETEFGGCSTIEKGECDGYNPIGDPSLCYLTTKGRKYWELMIKHNLHTKYINSPICPFSLYYQFYRELIFALENSGYYVILIDKKSPAFTKDNGVKKRGLIPILTNDLTTDIRQYIKIVFIQDILQVLEKHNYNWVNIFKEKYGF